MRELWEISDLIVDYDPQTLERRQVKKSEVVARLTDNRQRWAARIASTLPTRDDILDPDAVDLVLFRAHAEIQRLSEEFRQERRVWTLLGPLVDCLRERGISPIRVVDVGCGVGYLIRALARDHAAEDIEFWGVDLNKALIDAADKLAREEELPAQFHHANAFRLDAPAHIFLSSGTIHHFRGDALSAFFADQRRLKPQAFLHFDIQPSWASPVGAFLFHRARFQEALSRHDGYCSALRAHPGPTLLDAAADPDGSFRCRLFDHHGGLLPIFRVMQAIVGVREDLEAPWLERLGSVTRRLGAPS